MRYADQHNTFAIKSDSDCSCPIARCTAQEQVRAYDCFVFNERFAPLRECLTAKMQQREAVIFGARLGRLDVRVGRVRAHHDGASRYQHVISLCICLIKRFTLVI